MSPAKTAEPIEMPFGTWIQVGPRKHVLDGSAHWRNLANTSEPSMCSDDTAFLSNYSDHLLLLEITTVIMVALCTRTEHYIFILFLLLLFFPHLISTVGDWMSTILRHMVWS